VGLTDEELARLGRLREPWEGLDFENLLEAINQRLAGDSRRNERLVESIEGSAECSILFFTNSVAHGEEMSARLNLAGIGAAAISGSTPTVARRYFLDRFQGGAAPRAVQSQRADHGLRCAQDRHGADRPAGFQPGALHADGRSWAPR
jgi:superfamily II DNA or RNA helicase